jgi:hypothetical protein
MNGQAGPCQLFPFVSLNQAATAFSRLSGDARGQFFEQEFYLIDTKPE